MDLNVVAFNFPTSSQIARTFRMKMNHYMMTSHSIIILLIPSIQFPNIKIPKGHRDVAYEQYGRFQTTTHMARAQRTKADASNGSVCRVTEDCSVPTQTA